MSPKRIENLMKHMSLSLKEKDIIDDFPSIIDDLEYIIRIYKLKIEGLTENQRINHIYDIEYYKTEFLAELMKKYMVLTYKQKFSYEIGEGEILISSGGYDQEKDIVNLSIIGLLLNSENTADILIRISHEYRHQYFFHFMHENSIEGILKYPSYFITIAKNYIPKPLNNKYNEKKEFIDNPYYNDNHPRMYSEIDANSFGLNTVRRFLLDLYELYPNKNSKLENKVNRLQEELIKESRIVEKVLKQEKRLESKYLDELYLQKPIDSTVLVDKEEKDSLLYADRTLKNNPIIKDKYEVLNILMNDYRFKNYHELLIDKYSAINKYGNKSKISIIYDNIINADPMILITKLVEEKNIAGITKFLNDHPTFKDEYKEEITELFSNLVSTSEIINLLSIEEKITLEKK
ncbi:MAG: hypothetical protein IK137_02925 [Bacilli bacterium]|nr:hypothetical protein [Bacilli bacterium]